MLVCASCRAVASCAWGVSVLGLDACRLDILACCLQLAASGKRRDLIVRSRSAFSCCCCWTRPRVTHKACVSRWDQSEWDFGQGRVVVGVWCRATGPGLMGVGTGGGSRQIQLSCRRRARARPTTETSEPLDVEMAQAHVRFCGVLWRLGDR